MISALGEAEEGLFFFITKTGIFHHQLHGLLWVKLARYYEPSSPSTESWVGLGRTDDGFAGASSADKGRRGQNWLLIKSID